NQSLIVRELKYKSDANGFHDDKKAQIILYDFKKDSFQCLTKKHVNHSIQDISQDGNHVLFTANYAEDADYPQKQSLFILNRETMAIKRASREDGAFQHAKFTKDQQYIITYFHNYAYASATLSDLVLINIASGKLETISTDWDIQLGDVLIGDTR